jgi:ABC-type branched-subunit amino acid transport system substrate-binding protein
MQQPGAQTLRAFLVACALASAHPATADILIGQSAGFTGGQASYSKDVRDGILAYFQAVNRAGGIEGQQLKLIEEDDQGKKDLVVANTKKFVEKDNVFALIGYTSGAGTEGALPIAEAARVPMLSPASGNMGIRAQHHRYLFHTRAGYDAEMKYIVDTTASLGMSRYALVYLQDAAVNRPAMEAALAANNLKPVAAFGIDRNAKDFGPVVEKLLAAKPDAVLFITNGPPLAAIVRGMKKGGYAGEFISSSFSGTKVIDDLKDDAVGLKVVQVLPSPKKNHIRLIKDFREHLQQLDAKATPNYTSLEGYVAARVLVEGLRRAGKNPTREKFVNALESFRQVDLGGYDITFSPINHNGSRFIEIGVVNLAKALVF